jgi:hypothetical protein
MYSNQNAKNGVGGDLEALSIKTHAAKPRYNAPKEAAEQKFAM